MLQVGAPFTVTVFSQVVVQPFATEVVVRVKLPAAPAVTLIGEPTFGPTMLPLPEICVVKVAPATFELMV